MNHKVGDKIVFISNYGTKLKGEIIGTYTGDYIVQIEGKLEATRIKEKQIKDE